MFLRGVPALAAMACILILIIVMRVWKQKVLSWGWLGLLMIFLPQAQGMFRPNSALYVMLGLVSTVAGILIYTIDMAGDAGKPA